MFPLFLGILSDIVKDLVVTPSKEISESSTALEDSGIFVDGMMDTLMLLLLLLLVAVVVVLLPLLLSLITHKLLQILLNLVVIYR